MRIGASATPVNSSNINKVIHCPKCGYQRTPADQQTHAGVCPACGIAYAKWRQDSQAQPEYQHPAQQDETIGRFREIIRFFLFIPEHTDITVFWGRVILLVLFAIWGGYFVINGVNWQTIGASFLHNVNLPFHEFGHVLFSPFGRFMAILGGSLFQILMPLIAMVSFSWQMRDNFAGAMMLWWSGQNMIDVSPYIADAEYRSIPLIRDLSEDYHDWGNLLTMLDCVDAAQTIANTVFSCGAITIGIALYWAGYLLLRQKQTLRDIP